MLRLIIAILLPLWCVAAESAPKQSPPAGRPFRMTFTAWDGEPAKPETLVFNITMHDFRIPFCMPPLGSLIPRTKIRLERFEQKTRKTPTGKLEDFSELTLFNTETKKSATLVLGQQQDVGEMVEVRISPIR